MQRWNDKEYWAKAWATLSWIGDRPPPTDGRDYRVQAEEAWKQGNALKAGRLIFENRPPDERPGWAAAILRLVLDRSGIERAEDQAGWVARVLGFHRCAVNLSTFKQVLDTAENSEQWANGHPAFDRLRREVLVLENVARTRRLTKEEQTHQAVLLLAELVAKVSTMQQTRRIHSTTIRGVDRRMRSIFLSIFGVTKSFPERHGWHCAPRCGSR